ncbi:MAG: hypothetical protein ACYDH4_09575 [Candidatus Cryosericum sp.]
MSDDNLKPPKDSFTLRHLGSGNPSIVSTKDLNELLEAVDALAKLGLHTGYTWPGHSPGGLALERLFAARRRIGLSDTQWDCPHCGTVFDCYEDASLEIYSDHVQTCSKNPKRPFEFGGPLAGPMLVPQGLEQEAASLLETIRILSNEREAMLQNLAATQKRCTELLNRYRIQTPDEVTERTSKVLEPLTWLEDLPAGPFRTWVENARFVARWVMEAKVN